MKTVRRIAESPFSCSSKLKQARGLGLTPELAFAQTLSFSEREGRSDRRISWDGVLRECEGRDLLTRSALYHVAFKSAGPGIRSSAVAGVCHNLSCLQRKSGDWNGAPGAPAHASKFKQRIRGTTGGRITCGVRFALKWL